MRCTGLDRLVDLMACYARSALPDRRLLKMAGLARTAPLRLSAVAH